MAIEKTQTIQRIEVYPAVDENDNARLMVVFETTFDDSSDADFCTFSDTWACALPLFW